MYQAYKKMLEITTRSWIVQAIGVAADLSIADHLAQRPRSVEELAAEIDVDAKALARLLRSLAGQGIFVAQPDGTYSNTPLSELLCSDAQDSLREWARFARREWLWRCAGGLLESIKTGKDWFALNGTNVFEYLSTNQEDGEQFLWTMTAYSAAHHRAGVEAYDWPNVRTIVDVGGAHGSFLIAFLRKYPQARGVLFDLPQVIESAREALAHEEEGIAERIVCCDGDFFVQVPEGGDLYVLSEILHDWNEENSVRILRKCREAMHPESRLIISELVLPDTPNTPHHGLSLDLIMLACTAGQERTATEYAHLIAQAGLQMTRVIHTEMDVSLVEAIPA